MSLSKPSTIVYKLVEIYYNGLFNNPIRTKAFSSCVISLLGNITSQYVSGAKRLNPDSLIAFGLFGLIFGGPLPHFFYEILERIAPNESSFTIFKHLFMERLIFTPLYQFLFLYMLARFEGKSHDQTMSQVMHIYIPVLKANYKWLTVLQFLNFAFVPQMMRVLVNNLIGYIWVVFLTQKRQQADSSRRNRLG